MQKEAADNKTILGEMSIFILPVILA